MNPEKRHSFLKWKTEDPIVIFRNTRSALQKSTRESLVFDVGSQSFFHRKFWWFVFAFLLCFQWFDGFLRCCFALNGLMAFCVVALFSIVWWLFALLLCFQWFDGFFRSLLSFQWFDGFLRCCFAFNCLMAFFALLLCFQWFGGFLRCCFAFNSVMVFLRCCFAFNGVMDFCVEHYFTFWSRPFGTWICSICETNTFSEIVVTFPDYSLRIPLGTFSILLSMVWSLFALLLCLQWFDGFMHCCFVYNGLIAFLRCCFVYNGLMFFFALLFFFQWFCGFLCCCFFCCYGDFYRRTESDIYHFLSREETLVYLLSFIVKRAK